MYGWSLGNSLAGTKPEPQFGWGMIPAAPNILVMVWFLIFEMVILWFGFKPFVSSTSARVSATNSFFLYVRKHAPFLKQTRSRASGYLPRYLSSHGSVSLETSRNKIPDFSNKYWLRFGLVYVKWFWLCSRGTGSNQNRIKPKVVRLFSQVTQEPQPEAILLELNSRLFQA